MHEQESYIRSTQCQARCPPGAFFVSVNQKKIFKSNISLKNPKRSCRSSSTSYGLSCTCFQSHCNYAILTWGHTAQVSTVFKLQRRAARVVGGLLYRADVRETFMNLKILTLSSLFILSSLVYVKNNKPFSSFSFT